MSEGPACKKCGKTMQCPRCDGWIVERVFEMDFECRTCHKRVTPAEQAIRDSGLPYCEQCDEFMS
jgi:primosomal protein N'